jgi:hypothetical protein
MIPQAKIVEISNPSIVIHEFNATMRNNSQQQCQFEYYFGDFTDCHQNQSYIVTVS